MSETITVETKDVRLENLIFIISGIVLVVFHALIFIWNPNIFTIVVSMYIIVYIIIMLILFRKKKECTTEKEKSLIFYLSTFVLIIEIGILGLGIFMFIKSIRNTPKPQIYY